MDNLARLERPTGKVDVVIDTDTYNEIDDQFALAYGIKSDDKLTLKAIYAAPFFNDKVSTPDEGMCRSYEEIIKILELMKREDLKAIVHKGSRQFLIDETQPVISDAALHLVELSKAYSSDKPLYVIAIGAITNIAAAILIDPDIIHRINIVWLGGNAYNWPNNKEFNAFQDVAAMRVVFNSRVPLVQVPCMGVVSAFTTTGPELNFWLSGKNVLCDYLVKNTEKEAKKYHSEKTWSRPIWDVCAVGWLMSEAFMEDRIEVAPLPEHDHTYTFLEGRHAIRYVYHINRDRLMEDLFEKLAK